MSTTFAFFQVCTCHRLMLYLLVTWFLLAHVIAMISIHDERFDIQIFYLMTCNFNMEVAPTAGHVPTILL